MASKNIDSRCKARRKDGKPCGAAATAGGLCFFHANPNKASELGRVGGRSKRVTVPENAEPLPPLDSVFAVRDTVDRLIADVYAGELNPRIAAGLAPLLQLQLRALDATDMKERLSRLEGLVKKREQRSTGAGGKRPGKPIRRIGTFCTPETASDSQEETEPPVTLSPEQEEQEMRKKGLYTPGACLEPRSLECVTEVQAQEPSGNTTGPPIQDMAAAAGQAGHNVPKPDNDEVVTGGQSVPARPPEKEHSEPRSPSVQEPARKTRAAGERGADQGLPDQAQRAPASSVVTGAPTGSGKSDQEIRDELWKQAQEAYGRGDLMLKISKPK